MASKESILGILILLSTLSSCCSYNILAVLVSGSRSHMNIMDGVLEALLEGGHKLTVVTAFPHKQLHPNMTEVVVAGEAGSTEEASRIFLEAEPEAATIFDLVCLNSWGGTVNTLADPNVQTLLKGNHKFDITIVDIIFNEVGLALAYHFGRSPVLYIGSSKMFPNKAWNLNIPTPYAAIPNLLSGYALRMDFWERLKNSLYNVYFTIRMHYFLYPKLDAEIARYLPGIPPILELERNVSLTLSNTDPATDYPRPTTPTYIEVGGISVAKPKPLPKDIEDIIQKSDGFVFFSLGTVAQSRFLKPEIQQGLVKAFGKLKITVLWKLEGDLKLDGVQMPKNLHTFKWLPQTSLLAHPKCRLFITHCGMLSLMEAVHFNMPMVAIPLFAEQIGNAQLMEERGVLKVLNKRHLDEDVVYNAVQEVLSNPKYRDAMRPLSQAFRDRPQDLKEKSRFWVEYVVRHKGAKHLALPGQHLNFIQYFLLDILAVALLSVIISIVVIGKLMKRILFKPKTAVKAELNGKKNK